MAGEFSPNPTSKGVKHLHKKITALLCALALLCAGLPAARAIPPASPELRQGMDVSVYQGDVDFSAARAGGIELVYLRASYGFDGVDACFRAHTAGARDAGIPYGYYHYVTARTPEEARRQADFFADTIAGTGYALRPAMDFEALDGLTVAQASAVAVAFLSEVEARTGHTPVVYSDDYNASHRFDASVARWPLWAAAYGPSEPQVTANWSAWVGFQYTDKGRVPGVNGYVDLDRFTLDVVLETPEPATFLYTVRRGDTLWGLSRRYGTTVAELVRLNRIANPNLIYAGQVLRIPGERPDYFTYTIRPGDTLWTLALRFHTTVAELVALNGIANPNLIYVGATLKIPG